MTDRRMFRYMVPVDDRAYTYPLTNGCDPLAVAATADSRSVEFWAEHDEGATQAGRTFQVFGTGHPLPDDARWVGTCARTPGGLVWHLFERGQP